MESKSNDSTPQRPEGSRVIDASLVTIDLPSFIRQIREESTWTNSDRNAITIFKTTGLRMVLMALHAGAEMAKHTANGVITLQILEGRIQFTTEENSVELPKGQILTLHERIPHSVLAKEETIFLLTLANAPK